MQGHDRVLSVEKTTENKFLNMYDLQYENKVGGHGVYHIASRAMSMEELKMKTRENKPDGVIIYSLYGEKKDHVVLVRQYRFSIDDFVYEFPAGLVDKGEDPAQAGNSEKKEDTRLDFVKFNADEMMYLTLFSSIGMTDESVATVYGCSTGQVSREGLEDNEEIEVVLADRTEVRRILKEEKLSINCAYLLMHFLHHTEEDPFYFLRDE